MIIINSDYEYVAPISNLISKVLADLLYLQQISLYLTSLITFQIGLSYS